MLGLYRYNAVMNSATAERLLRINRKFYEDFGTHFSATRQRLQPGVKKILDSIGEDVSVLDLGCGNGYFLRELSAGGHRAALLGLDFSLPLLRDAGSTPGVKFRELDLTKLSASSIADPSEIGDGWDLITMFATLHHIPSTEIRLDILRTVRKLLNDKGQFILSNWQFLNSEKLKARIQPWEEAGIQETDLDPGDFLLDWRSGGRGLRYVHQFSAEELLELAGWADMRVMDSFLSDGDGRDLALYQIWRLK